jgi:HAD superfamily hydrolase (TIGR01549 family)
MNSEETAVPTDRAEADPGQTAVLFDIDGTLVDSNYLHIETWDRAFVSVGHPVDVWRIHRAIGMDSAKLLERLLGDDASRVGDDAKDEHSRLYLGLVDRLREIAGARELLQDLAEKGYRVVLATSAPQNELDILLSVLDLGDTVDAVTSSEDVGTAKPDPDIIGVALDKAGVPAERAVMVGDSVWDIAAAERAGVRSIGVLSGGFGRGELLDAGAAAVYDDVADLHRNLATSPVVTAQG